MGFLEEEIARRSLHEYVEALEVERKKMLVFHRELPFSLELVSRALESYRLQLGVEVPAPARSDCEEETSSEGLVLKEFIPTTKGGSDEDEEEEEEREQNRELDQRDWLRSVQLHEPQVELPPEEDLKVVKPITVEAKRTTGAFQPFVKVATTAAATASSTVATEGSGGRCCSEEKDGRGQRKTRRCWSPELHHRFLQALQQLGGSHVATPKQIRELMKVDGLTNDEVKSHLQKYRLHTSRKSPPAQPNSSSNLQTAQPQIVFIGSLWTPPAGPMDRLPSTAAAAHPSTDHVSSFTMLQPQNKKQKLMSCREERSIHGGSSNLESTATTTSSSHTITTTESPQS